jgi:hypothetical protein
MTPADASLDAGSEPTANGLGYRLRLIVPCALERTGKEMKFVIGGADESAIPDPSLVRLLLRAHALSQRLASNPGSPLSHVGSPGGYGCALCGSADAPELPRPGYCRRDPHRPPAHHPHGHPADGRHPPTARMVRAANGSGLRLSCGFPPNAHFSKRSTGLKHTASSSVALGAARQETAPVHRAWHADRGARTTKETRREQRL